MKKKRLFSVLMMTLMVTTLLFGCSKPEDNGETKEMIEYSLKLGSNPEFTSSVLVAYARAAARQPFTFSAAWCR